MTAARAWDFQTGLYGLVSAALAGEAEGGGDVPVYNRAKAHPPSMFARIDGHSIAEAELKTGAAARHAMTVHLFQSDAGGRAEIKRLVALLDAALRGAVVAGGALQIESTTFQADDDGQAEHAMMRVSAWVAPESSVELLTDGDGAPLLDDAGDVMTGGAE